MFLERKSYLASLPEALHSLPRGTVRFALAHLYSFTTSGGFSAQGVLASLCLFSYSSTSGPGGLLFFQLEPFFSHVSLGNHPSGLGLNVSFLKPLSVIPAEAWPSGYKRSWHCRFPRTPVTAPCIKELLLKVCLLHLVINFMRVKSRSFLFTTVPHLLAECLVSVSTQ